MKRSLLVFLAACLFWVKGAAQTISNVDLTKVYSAIEDDASPFYYPPLLERYLANDSMLTFLDYHHLYYGYTKHPDYLPYGRGVGEMAAVRMMEEGRLNEARELLLSEYRKSPFNLNLLFRLGSLADLQQNPTEARMWLMKFSGLLRTILSSGDGRTEETAWVIITTQDEYPIMGILGLESAGQGLLKSKYDVQTLKTPNDLETEKLYFNIEMPVEHMSKAYQRELAESDTPAKPKKVNKTKTLGVNQ
ncbi:DUF4919 domain-containing protein [Rufibacter psychrotolerans]|uniref:DUF4919 domain-containing protein n=1 Tax=Rufibacter psychrotolerans TaxID=2812556 RepID=UPI00196897EF|nr:DUF4919 domain-containing protein [Rufibacter sp. SYSU D00308]